MFYEMWVNNRSSRAENARAQRTEAERESDFKAIVAAHMESGARPIIMCDSGWSDERYPEWGITAFPDLPTRLKEYQMFVESGYFQRNEPPFTLLGTATEGPHTDLIQPGMVYSLWVMRSDPHAIAARKEFPDEMLAEAMKKFMIVSDRVGRCGILTCDTYWANDAYYAFGVEAFPNLEALQEFKAELLKMDWPIYVPAVTFLGVLSPLQEQIKTVFK